jgi:MFS-type transporter involved in bile tolerance (Atg22 family)
MTLKKPLKKDYDYFCIPFLTTFFKMKQKVIIILILASLTAIIYATKKGVFNSGNSDYVNLKLPDVVDYNFLIFFKGFFKVIRFKQ